MKESTLEATVGMSQKWDAREAGREVARTAISDLKHPPNFFLLFATYHYEKNGGYEEFLKGVWEILPQGTPLIGGIVAGFSNHQGCFVRGAVALAVSYPHMDVAIGYGKKTKRYPKRAARQCAKMLENKLQSSTYPHKFIFDVISGGLVPQMLGFGRKKVIRGFSSRLALSLSHFSLTVLQKGVGREDEVLRELAKYVDDYFILHVSSMDDGRAFSNYQFYDHMVGTNMIVALGVRLDLDMDIFSNHNLTVVKPFQITKLSKDKRIIHEINGKPAGDAFLRLLEWPEQYFDEKLFRRTYFYPIGFKENGVWSARVIAIILGNAMTVTHQITNTETAVLSVSGKKMLDAVTMNLNAIDCEHAVFGLVSECAARLVGLGADVYVVRDEIKNHLGDTPFLVLYSGGEAIKKPHEPVQCGNITFNTFIVKDTNHKDEA
jgi:hypothetical protein